MGNPIIKAAIRAKFLMTSRKQGIRVIRSNEDSYLRLVRQVGAESSGKPVLVPAMMGIDPEMRDWSLFQILEHNAIVNRSIAATVEALALGREPSGAALINPKTDVLPKGLSGSEQVEAFRSSVDDYLCRIAPLTELRGTAETLHPIFGSFDAHKWHCMFGFHLGLHLRQAEKVLSLQGS